MFWVNGRISCLALGLSWLPTSSVWQRVGAGGERVEDSWAHSLGTWPWALNEREIGSRCFLRESRSGFWECGVFLAVHPGQRFQFLTVNPAGECELADLCPGHFDIAWAGSFDDYAHSFVPDDVEEFVQVPGKMFWDALLEWGVLEMTRLVMERG